MPILKMEGKLVYIWRPKQIFGGDVSRIVDALLEANVDGVAIKLHDGYYRYPDIAPVIKAIRAAGIKVGGWGYIYLYYPTSEAQAAVNSCREYGVDFYLIDAESQAKNKFSYAEKFSNILRANLPDMPIALNSFWKPSYHRELPWHEFRSICDFDCPQLYWRGGDPVAKLAISKNEYAAMTPSLPFSMVAGEMYSERGIRTTPEELFVFLNACNKDPEIKSVVMWSMDQISGISDLWKVFSEFDWDKGGDSPPPPSPVTPLYHAVTTGYLNVRSSPWGAWLYTMSPNTLVDVWALDGLWAALNQEKTKWSHTGWLDKVPDEPLYYARTTANLNVRNSPWGKILETLPLGTIVSVWRMNGVWGAINPNMAEWVHTGYLARLV